MLLLDPTRIHHRRAMAAGPLAPLARSLATELEPLMGREPFVPAEKARMTRLGGRCPTDRMLLDFDPWSPRAHRCPRCGATYVDEEHYRWWIMSYQLWLAERAVHGALLSLVGEDGRPGALADAILRAYADRYLAWPNADNVLGPTRPFFSTYLESIWLLQLCVALDLREAAGCDAALGATVRERLIAPSRELIAGYDEGLSNRQTWNAAALLAASLLLGDRDGAGRAVHGENGIEAHLRHGLLLDGTWYEGENYHLFAHRALWYGVTMAERAGIALDPTFVARFEEGFAAPFASALPDLTFPSRRDSQYAVSLRQWRFAELCELGLARRDDARLTGALAKLYASGLPPADTGRARSTAEAERNGPATPLDRASLGWKSLLHARPELPPLAARAPVSVLLEGQGLAVLRRDAGRVYAALDYGHSGGGHGHPDRLNLLLARGETRWLDDYGTGSYVDPSLHWYRSTLAHNAPLVNGRSQERVHGVLLAHEERGGAGWVEAEAAIAPGVSVRRALVAMPDYLVDIVAWDADDDVVLDLPIQADGELSGASDWHRFDPGGSGGLEDGFRFLTSAEQAIPLTGAATLEARSGVARADAFILPPDDAQLWRALALGPPGTGHRRLHVVRGRGREGEIVTVWSWRRTVASVQRADDRLVVLMRDGSRHEHERTMLGWHVALAAHGGRSSIDLGGRRVDGIAARIAKQAQQERPPELRPCRLHLREPVSFELGEDSWRRSEQSWSEAGRPRATVVLRLGLMHLSVLVEVRKQPLAFAPESKENPLDNEPSEINGDGVQLYLRPVDGAPHGWLLAPSEIGEIRVRPIGTQDLVHILVNYARTDEGYRVQCILPREMLGPQGRFDLDVVVNEKSPERERRRGQLVLSGGRGEFVYLRGDRQPAERLLPFLICNG